MKVIKIVFLIYLAMSISLCFGIEKSDYVGLWQGFIQTNKTLLTINTDGSVEMKAAGQTLFKKLVKNEKDEYFITDLKDNRLFSLVLNGSALYLISPDAYAYSFVRQENELQ